MRIEEHIIDGWQKTWDWCNNNLTADQWDMIYKQETDVVFSVDETVYMDFYDRNAL